MTAPSANPHLLSIRRDSDCIGGRRAFVCLDRNERPSPWPATVFAEMMAQVNPLDLVHYPDLGPLYERLCRVTGLEQSQLCVGAGSDSLIRRLFQAYLRPGDTVVTPEPTYGMYSVWSRLCQARHIGVAYGEDLKLPFEAFLEVVRREKPRIVAVANPDQPTGSAITRDKILSLIEVCAELGSICVIDEAYYPFSPFSMIGDIPDHSSLVVLRSFSKSAGIAGLRVGFAAAAPEIVRMLHALRSPGEVSSVSAIISSFLLDRPELTEAYVRDVAEGREVLLAGAAKLGFSGTPNYGNFQLLEVPRGMDPKSLVKSLEAKRFLIKGGFSQRALENFVRVTLDGRAIIEPFVESLGEASKELQRDS